VRVRGQSFLRISEQEQVCSDAAQLCAPEPMISTGRRDPFAVPPAVASSMTTMQQYLTSLHSKHGVVHTLQGLSLHSQRFLGPLQRQDVARSCDDGVQRQHRNITAKLPCTSL
jgi:hypothetical protein